MMVARKQKVWRKRNTGRRGGGHAHFEGRYAAGILVV
jgi:hypothetical protein